MYTIDIDIGSTSTDGFFSSGDEFKLAKVLTTPHDLAECTMSCVEAGARQFDTDVQTFLRGTGVTRLSTTLATNVVVQRAGAKIGLLVTAGHESALYGPDPEAGVLDLFVPREMVAGIVEEVDTSGAIVREPARDDVLEQVRLLVGRGARMIVVSLRHAWRNDGNERLVREHIRQRYPAQYLRSVPVQLGTEVMHASDDHARTNSVVLNAYVHSEMARNLYRIEDRLRDRGARRPLLVVHAHGGSGRIAKTVALQTVHAGPAVAARGAARLAQLMGVDRVLTVDMGGTSFDAAVIVDEVARLHHRPRLDGIEVAMPMVEVESIAGGGSSVAWVDDGVVRVGPRSAGLAPGPACFGRGGTEPTLTDANVVLGFIRPDYFLGGALQLDRSRAERALERRLAAPLGVGVAEAAAMVRTALADEATAKLRTWIVDRGYVPSEFTLFVLGGNSALHACLLAERLGIRSLLAFPYSSVFSAFGANTTDVEHRYRRVEAAALGTVSRPAIARRLATLFAQASRDMTGEGFDLARVSALVELECLVGGRVERRSLDTVDLAGADPVAIADKVEAAWRETNGVLQAIDLLARAPLSHWLPEIHAGPSESVPARGDTRDVTWDGVGSMATQIYDETALAAGAPMRGPAIIESPITNYAIAPGWSATVDRWGNLSIIRDE